VASFRMSRGRSDAPSSPSQQISRLFIRMQAKVAPRTLSGEELDEVGPLLRMKPFPTRCPMTHPRIPGMYVMTKWPMKTHLEWEYGCAPNEHIVGFSFEACRARRRPTRPILLVINGIPRRFHVSPLTRRFRIDLANLRGVRRIKLPAFIEPGYDLYAIQLFTTK
jgi:hypothetical protein